MDIIPKFYIFGVPDGFDMLDGTSAEITYFQKFYNGSTENTKFSIHRDAKGNITYTYLKYNLSSVKSRTGSFLGISLIFHNVYCANILRLYDLFDWVYNSYILIDEKDKQGKTNGFLKPIKGDKDIQARYEITRFQEKREYIQRCVENVLLGNIKENFENDFSVIDNSFSNEHPNLVVQEPLQSASNEKLLTDLQNYNRVAISPDWIPQPQTQPEQGKGEEPQTEPTSPSVIVLAPEYIEYLLNCTKAYQDYIIDSYKDLSVADIETARAVLDEVSGRLNEVTTTSSTDKRASQIIRDYTLLIAQLEDLIKKIKEGSTEPTVSTVYISNPIEPVLPWWKNPKIIGIGASSIVVLASLLILLFIQIKSPAVASPDRQPVIAQETRNLIAEGKYEEAILMADSLDITLRKHLQDSAKEVCNESLVQEIQTQMNSNHYTFAYETWEKMYDGEMKNTIKTEIISKCEEYLQGRLSRVNDKESAKSLMNDINNCQVPIDKKKKNDMIVKLNTIITPPASGTRSTTTTTTQPYTVKIWKADASYNIKKNSDGTELNPIFIIDSNQNIVLERNQKYRCKVFSNGQVVTAEGIAQGSCPDIILRRDGAITIYVSPDFGNNQTIKIGNSLTITIKIQE